MKHTLVILTLLSSLALAQIDMRVGTFNVRGDDYTYRLSVHPDGFVALENFDEYRYGVLADGGNTLSFTFLPSDEASLMAFQPEQSASYNVTMRDTIFLEFENDVSGSFLVMKRSDEPSDAVPAEVRAQLTNVAQQAVNTQRQAGVSVTLDDFVGRWRRDRDDMDLVLEFLPSGGYRSTLNGAVFYGTVNVSGTELTLNGFGTNEVSVIPIQGIGYKRETFYAIENGESISYRKEGEPTVTDADIAVARTLVNARATSNQANSTFAQAIVGQWQTISGDMFITVDYRADNTYDLYITSLTQGNSNVRGTYSVQGTTLTQRYPDGNEEVYELESLVAGSFMKFANANTLWLALVDATSFANTFANTSPNTATPATAAAAPATTTNNTAATATNNYVNNASDVLSLTLQHEMEMQQIQMINDAINQSAQMTQGIAWDISGTSWGWDYGY